MRGSHVISEIHKTLRYYSFILGYASLSMNINTMNVRYDTNLALLKLIQALLLCHKNLSPSYIDIVYCTLKVMILQILVMNPMQNLGNLNTLCRDLC